MCSQPVINGTNLREGRILSPYSKKSTVALHRKVSPYDASESVARFTNGIGSQGAHSLCVGVGYACLVQVSQFSSYCERPRFTSWGEQIVTGPDFHRFTAPSVGTSSCAPVILINAPERRLSSRPALTPSPFRARTRAGTIF